jgi:hypothetical protein
MSDFWELHENLHNTIYQLTKSSTKTYFLLTGIVIYITFLMIGRPISVSMQSRRGALQLEYSIRSLIGHE